MHQHAAGYGAARTDGSASDQGVTITPGYGGAVGYGTAPVVSFQNVSKHYGSLRAVDGLSLDLRPGQTVALLGPNGAGKSTSLDMLLALRKPTSGKIQMFGSDPYHAVKIGSDVIGNTAVSARLAVGLVVWLGIFVALATVSVRATAETV